MSNLAQIKPELLAPFTIGECCGLKIAIEPINDSEIARRAEATTQGLVHLWVISAEGKPLTQADLDNAGITVDDLARFVVTKRASIGAHYLPGRHAPLFLREHCFVDDQKIVHVSFILHT